MSSARRLAVVLTTVAVAIGWLPAAGAAAAAELPGARYTALATPTRIVDTRTDTGGHPKPLGAGETMTVAVPGVPADATAVVINLTGTGGTSDTFLSAFPTQFANTSTLNLALGETAAVAAVVTLGPDRAFRVLNRNGSIDMVVDLVGYLGTGGGDGFASAASPTRILDTRATNGGHPSALGPGQQLTLPVRGVAGVPTTATSVVVNLTGVTPTANTFLRVTPSGGASTSTLNLAAGVTRANLAVAGIGSDGAIRIANLAGDTHVIADVVGWFAPGAGGRYIAAPAPARVMDTRLIPLNPIEAGETRSAALASAAVPPGGRTAALLTVTAAYPTEDTHLITWPQGGAQPQTSTLNLPAGKIVSNATIVEGAGVSVYNHRGEVDGIVDAAGYFYTPTRAEPTVPSAPTLTQVRNSGARVQLAWTPPSDDGGLPLTGYTVTLRPGGRTITVGGHQNKVTVDGTVNGERYTVSVAATNFAGTGQATSRPTGPGPAMTRIDKDAAGTPDTTNGVFPRGLSADGRYVLLSVRSSSVLVPEPFRTAQSQGSYAMRKDLRTGELELVGLDPAGRLVRMLTGAISRDGDTVVYEGYSPDDVFGIYVRDLTTGAVHVVPAPTSTTNLALSADERRLTFGAADGVYRHDLTTGVTEELLNCPEPIHGCALSNPKADADGTTFVLDYRRTPTETSRLTLLNADTGELRTLPEGERSTYAISGDGQWVFYSCETCPDRFVIRKVATTPGAVPTTVKAWTDGYTWVVNPYWVNHDGTLLTFERQRGDGQWYGSAPGYVFDLVNQREVMLPQARDIAFLNDPMISADGSTVVGWERCLTSIQDAECLPIGVYSVSVPAMLGG
ncbi:fibronectin type III domain-containing protein [Actinophytocola sp.]|uniref:fibronectin type III domain-containing protein n=1 Tax=Actinophytocola sp. TaxID=1872138 RepID=UPI002ED67D0F